MPWEAILAVLAFVAGGLWLDRRKKKTDVKERVERVDADAEGEKTDAEKRYQERLARARDAADAGVADRPRGDDPVADLRDRLNR